MTATVATSLRLDPAVAEAMARIVPPRGRNKYIEQLIRADLERRGELKRAPARRGGR